MKYIPTEFYSITEIGGVGEMVYKAVRFPECVPEYDHARKEEMIVPVFTYMHAPKSGTDYKMNGQDILVSLCNLYQDINAPDYTYSTTDMVWNWCRQNVHPYNIDVLCEMLKPENYKSCLLSGEIASYGTFDVNDFIKDLCKLGSAFEYYNVLQKVRFRKDVAAGRALYYEGRICDSMPFLEKFRRYESDEEYLEKFNENYHDLILNVTEMFPDIRWRLLENPKTHKIELGVEVKSVFDIAWYTFARLVADVAPPIDDDLNYMYDCQGSILTCMACGKYFVRHSSRQRYCQDPDCQAKRNNRKAKAYYDRQKMK